MGLTYADQLAIARRAEAAGFETLFRSDHYESFPGDPGGHTTDAWTVVAGLARDTTRIGLGVLVSPVTFRTPGNLAKVVVTADELSGGRIELGLGAGWHEDEHRRHGFPFPEIGERAEIAGGDAGDRPWAVGRAGRLVVHRASTTPWTMRCSGPSRPHSPGGTAADPNSSWADRGRRARSGSQPATRTSSTCPRPARTAPRSSSRSSTMRAAPRGASRPPWSTR